ncbi:MAG: hypothetical protein R3E89_19420 [Thiolinea sp.]
MRKLKQADEVAVEADTDIDIEERTQSPWMIGLVLMMFSVLGILPWA